MAAVEGVLGGEPGVAVEEVGYGAEFGERLVVILGPVEDHNLPGAHARAEGAGLGVLVGLCPLDDHEAGHHVLHAEAQVELGRGLAAAVAGRLGS